MKCRFCQAELRHEMVDLGFSPPSNAFLTAEQLLLPEKAYPLRVMVCEACLLVQLDEFARREEIFNSGYAYFSSFSTSWLDHCSRYADMIIGRLGLGSGSLVIEIASNDGYLLQFFKDKGIPVLGIEPSSNTAAAAAGKGIPTMVSFFGDQTARKLESDGVKADLVIGNNVLAHVPDINDFVSGLKTVLAEGGTVTMEFPHVMQLLDKNQFDTIYHEHFSYLSLLSVQKIFMFHGLGIFDVEEIPTHGGSLRIYACHTEELKGRINNSVEDTLAKESRAGLDSVGTYCTLQGRAERVKNSLNKLLIDLKSEGKKVVAYGAAAKGNTLINFCGIRRDIISFIADASPHKQNKFTPGMHIPVVNPSMIQEQKPDYVVILPWNIREEICGQLEYIRGWNGRFITAIPEIIIG